MSGSGDDSPLGAALAYAARGWAVLPCHSPEPTGRCSCGRGDCASPAKHPRVARGLTSASTEPGQIECWWRRWPGANVAVRTGAAGGLVVVDVDPRHGGARSLEALVAEHGEVQEAGRVATGGGGWHLYLAHPGGRVPNDAGRRLGPGLDIRGDGGYVLAPPSRHASGVSYHWLFRPPDLAVPPAWLGRRMVELAPQPHREAGRAVGLPKSRSDAWAAAALRGEAAAVAGTAEGSRNNRLNLAAFRLGQLVAAAHLEERDVASVLCAAAAAAGLGRREAERTIASGLSAGTRNPRSAARQEGHVAQASVRPHAYRADQGVGETRARHRKAAELTW